MSNDIFKLKNNDYKQLGFGLMRLPTVGNEIDVEQLKSMVDEYMQHGFYYFDTAFGYHKGKSEVAIKEALIQRYDRKDYLFATKMPAWKHIINNEQDAKNMFYTSLERTGAEYFDFYLMQNMGEERTHAFEKYHLWEFFEKLKKDNLVRYTGFSFHSNAEELERILKEHPEVDFVQLQLNYADWYSSSVQSKKCYEVALKYNKQIIVMEPIKGGSLINLHPDIQHCFDNSGVVQSNAAWALRFVASLKNVSMVLSGMSNIEQLRENIKIFENFTPMTESETQIIKNAQDIIEKIDRIECTSCNYCLDECPAKVKIPKIFEALNIKKIHNNDKLSQHFYFSHMFMQGSASSCLKCGHCEMICPQQLPIRKLLEEAKEYYGK